MKQQKGYTLIELLIVILIISIMTSVLIPTFSQRTMLSDVKLGAETVRGTILGAQIYALSITRTQLLDKAKSLTNELCTSIASASEINYVFVDFPASSINIAKIQMAISTDDIGATFCHIEKELALSSRLEIINPIRIYFKIGTAKMSPETETKITVKAIQSDLKADITINPTSGLVDIVTTP